MIPCSCWSKTAQTSGRPTEALVIREVYPACGSKRYKKNAHTRHGHQNHQCKTCEHQLSASADIPIITHERRTLIANLLRERISLRGLCRAMGVRLPTDQYAVYQGVILAKRHKPITKQARKTNYIERFNNTLRQRLSRRVRETLSFSKKLANHSGTIRLFICHDNLE